MKDDEAYKKAAEILFDAAKQKRGINITGAMMNEQIKALQDELERIEDRLRDRQYKDTWSRDDYAEDARDNRRANELYVEIKRLTDKE